MRKKGSTKTKDEPRETKPRRPRHTRHFYETANYLDTIGATAEQTMLCADVLAVWTRFMLAANPTAAGHVYRALYEAWGENRAEVDGDERDNITVLFHGAFLDRLREVRGEERGYNVTEFDEQRSERLAKLVGPILDEMRRRVASATAPAGASGRPAPTLRVKAGRASKGKMEDDTFASFGLLKGDVAEWEGTTDPRPGEIIRFREDGESASYIARLVSTGDGTLTVANDEGEECHTDLADVLWVCRLKSVTRTTEVARADPATDAAPSDSPVVDINLWRQSRPRPLAK